MGALGGLIIAVVACVLAYFTFGAFGNLLAATALGAAVGWAIGTLALLVFTIWACIGAIAAAVA